ncbi:MAG TPA: DUF3892 domain-containing protein, partial [Tepidisphaeraceae bacterium]
AQRVQVKCILKSGRTNLQERITHIGGEQDGQHWWMTEGEAIGDMELGTYAFYTLVDGERVDLVIAMHGGRRYLKTRKDELAPDTLLRLPECPD